MGRKSTLKKLRNRNKAKKVRRLRKSSFNRVRKDLEVFTNTDTSFDEFSGYESLAQDLDDNGLFYREDSGTSNGLRKCLYSRRDTIPVIAVESDGSDSDGNNGNIGVDNDGYDESGEEDEEEERRNTTKDDSLSMNDDFIPFSDSSDDEADGNDSGTGADNSFESDTSTSDTIHRKQNLAHPWLLNQNHSQSQDIASWLSTEIKDFVAFISPSKEEIESRNRVVKKLRHAVHHLWPDSTLHVFGSFATDLYLPGSDIDCVVTSQAGNKEQRNFLYELARHLKRSGLARDIEVIAKARVPIIKLTEPESRLHIDISFERLNGIEAAHLIRQWLQRQPGLRELVLVVKQFLKTRRMDDVHLGGLGGLSTVCLVYSFLSLHPMVSLGGMDPLDNLGVLLLDFLELYGKNFAYDVTAIGFENSVTPIYTTKGKLRGLMENLGSASPLVIQDPLDGSNNISRASYNLRAIKKALNGAFEALTRACYDMHSSTFRDRLGKTILGSVIKYRGKGRNFEDERGLVANHAIVENELYHKRKREKNEESDDASEALFLDPSDDEALTEGYNDAEMYRLEGEPPRKKLKTAHDGGRYIAGSKSRNGSSVNLDKLMGISDSSEQTDDVIINVVEGELEKEREKTEKKGESGDTYLKRITVDAQTRRHYWLSKGQPLTPNIANKNAQLIS